MPNQSTYWALTDLSGGVGNTPGGKVSIKVDGRIIPAAQFSMTYGLNAIPTATALVALGRDARTQERSAIYDEVENIKQMSPVTVEVTGPLGDWSPRGTDGSRTQWPGGTSVIFVGYVSGISYRRSMGRVSLVMNMVNQLVDLSMSSGGSADVVPGAPHDLMLPIHAEGPGGKPVPTASSKFIEELPADLNTDFSEGVLKALYYVSQENQLQIHKAWCDGGGPTGNLTTEERTNQRAAASIQGQGFWRGIEGYAKHPDYVGYVKPYPLQIHTSGRQHTAQHIGERISNSLAGTSMWSMLIGSILPEFGVGVVPTAQSAFIAPVLPMAREAAVILEPNDYVDFNLKTMSQRPLYGVGVMGSYQTAVIARSETGNKQCVGATFVAKSDDNESLNDGMWLFVPAPSWMDDWTNFDPAAIDGGAAVISMLGEVSHDATGVEDAAVERDPDEEVEDWNDVMSKYAQMVYASNALRGRQGTIVGKLRFDICPGTTVQVKSKGDLKSEGVDELAADLFGMVARVTVTINSEQSSAATTLELTNLRTIVENRSDRFSMETHPFFAENFFEKAPLVPGLTVTT